MREVFLLVALLLFHIPIVSHADVIHDAAKAGDVTAIAAALDAGADVNESDGLAAPLHYAVNRQHLDAAKLLIESGADVNAVSKLGGAPLMAAVTKNRLEFITLLLAHGADPNATAGKQAPVHVAIRKGCFDCVAALVEAGADVNALTTDPVPLTPIHLARFLDHSEISDYLTAHGVVLPKPAPIAEKLAAADVEKGQTFFGGNCDGCHCVLDLGVTQQYLDGADVSRRPVDHRRLRTTKRVGAVLLWTQTDGRNPFIDQAGILPCTHVACVIDPARECIVFDRTASSFEPR
jgi:cytochrome c